MKKILISGAKMLLTPFLKKGRLIGKIIGTILLLGVLFGIGIWGWNEYQNRAQIVTGIGSVSLGMTPVEVTLAIGKPSADLKKSERGITRQYIYLNYDNEIDYFIRFSDDSGDYRVTVVCSSNYLRDVLGFSRYDSESDIVEELGKPTNVSIRENGLEKMLSYKQWKAAFGIEKNEVKTVCATESGEMKYLSEYN